MYKIGFSRKYYTLWDCNVEVTDLGNGIRREMRINNYLKNISFDKNKVEALYPGVEIDESLKGHSRSFSYSTVIYPENVFKFGKYCGKTFEEIHDYDYMKWYFENTDMAQKAILRKILEDQDYHFEEWSEGYYNIYTDAEWKQKMQHELEKQVHINRITESFKNGTLEFVITRNPDSYGEYRDPDSDMIIKFDDVKENYYSGFYYYLPTINGKAKRVKNKRIHIINAEIEGDLIKVHNFEIVK